ncbi:hypothetical protein JCM10450v2_002182 [Rhodotorula kratochvilovae]
MAPFYPSAHSENVLRSHRTRSAATCAAPLLPLLSPTDTLLDIGCGPGTITASFAPYVASVTGVEHPAASSVLGDARRDARELGLEDKVSYIEADAAALPFADNSFDVVYCNQVLQHVPAPVAVLREMRRVARRLVFAREADRASFLHAPPTPAFTRFDALWSAVARVGGGEPDAARRLKGWALEAGFALGEVDVRAAGETPDPGEWGAMWATRAAEGGFADKAVELGFASRQELEKIARAWDEWSRRDDAWFGYLQGELLARKSAD